MNNKRNGCIDISIIIPTKNEEKYIERTIKQFDTYKEKYNIEIIVSDANSQDKTIEIASQIADKVVLANRTEKQNIAVGRNNGAKQAKGTLLFHTDADVIIPNLDVFFEIVNNTFENNKIIAATTSIYIYPDEETISDKFCHIVMNFLIKFSFLFGAFLAKGECQIVRKKDFNEIGGYNEEIVAGEDCNLFYRLNKMNKVVFLNKTKVYHSPRRFRNIGYIKLGLIYVREGINLLFRKKSYLKEWKPER